MAEQLFPTEDTFDFSGADEGALLYTLNSEAGDPPIKQPPVTPPKRKKRNFLDFETAASRFATNENMINDGFKNLATGIGSTPSGYAYQQKALQIEEAKKKKAELQQNVDYYGALNNDYVEDFVTNNMGTVDDILKGDNRFSEFVVTTPRGLEVSDSKLRRMLDKEVREAGGGDYTVSHYYGKIKGVADMYLQVWQNKDRINKRIKEEAGIADPETQKKIIADQVKRIVLEDKAKANELVQLSNRKIQKLQQTFDPIVADLTMDVNFYYQNVAKDVEAQMSKEMEGVTGILPSFIQNRFNERVQQEFLQRYGGFINDTVQPVLDQYVEAVNTEIKKTKAAVNRIARQSKKEATDYQNSFIATATEQQKQAAAKVSRIIEEEVKMGYERSKAQGKAYTQSMMTLSSMGSQFLGQVFGQSLASGTGNLMASTATFLQSMGINADWIDEMKYKGLDWQQDNSLGDASMKEFGLTPGYWAKMFGESLPTMAPGIITSMITRNPRVGMILGGVMEGAQIGGGITQQIADQTGDWNRARREGVDAFIKNIPTYFLEAPIHRAVAGMAGKNIAGNLAQSFAGEGAQEWLQTGAIELPATENVSIWQGMKDSRAIEAGVAGGVMGVAMSGSGIAGNMLFSKLPGARTQILTGSVMRFGKNGAVGAAQQESLGQDDAVLEQNLAEIEAISEQVEDAKTMGLNPGQTQLFAAKNHELKGLQEQRTQVKDPVAAEIIDEKIAEKKKEIAGVIKGETDVTTIEMPHGVMVSTETPKVGEIIQIPEIREGIKSGQVRIVTQDAGVQKQVEEIRQEGFQEQDKQPAPTLTFEQVEDIADELLVQMPKVPGLFGKFLQQLVEPDSRQRVVEAVIDQYNTDFETASKRYGEKVTEMVRPMVQQESNQAPTPEPVEVQQEQQPSNEAGNVAENNVTTTPAPSQETLTVTQQAPATEKAQAAPKVKPTANLSFLPSTALKNKTVSIPVRVAGTGKTTMKKMQAEKVQADIKARFKELKQLINCIG